MEHVPRIAPVDEIREVGALRRPACLCGGSRAEPRTRAAFGLDTEETGREQARHGGRCEPAGGRSRLCDFARGRQRDRCRGGCADGAQSRRASVLGHRGRGVHALPQRPQQYAHRVRRARSRAGRGETRSLPRSRRQTAAVLRCCGRRQIRRRAGRAANARARASAIRQATLGETLRARHSALRARLRGEPAIAFIDRRSQSGRR